MRLVRLELKIPPAILVAIIAVLMLFTARSLPVLTVPVLLRYSAYISFSGLGAFLVIAGVISFRKARTTVDPTTPQASSSLVTSGIYSKTRNPMYLGFLFILVAWAVFLSSLYSLVLVAGYVLYLNRFQIQAEERAMESLFGAEFLEYKSRVRRWL